MPAGGRGGRGGDRGEEKPKTAAELDREMDEYFRAADPKLAQKAGFYVPFSVFMCFLPFVRSRCVLYFFRSVHAFPTGGAWGAPEPGIAQLLPPGPTAAASSYLAEPACYLPTEPQKPMTVGLVVHQSCLSQGPLLPGSRLLPWGS